LREAFAGVPPERRTGRPAPDRWSAVEIVQHCVLVEQLVIKLLHGLVERARALPPESDDSALLPMKSVSRVEIRTRRVRTVPPAEPTDAQGERIWDDYAAARARLKTLIATADGLALGNVTAPHPYLGEFSGYEWIAFAGSHAARHADQIREMTVSLDVA
jgi:hypothetical protein